MQTDKANGYSGALSKPHHALKVGLTFPRRAPQHKVFECRDQVLYNGRAVRNDSKAHVKHAYMQTPSAVKRPHAHRVLDGDG